MHHVDQKTVFNIIKQAQDNEQWWDILGQSGGHCYIAEIIECIKVHHDKILVQSTIDTH